MGGITFSLLLNLVAKVASITFFVAGDSSIRLNGANFASIAVAFLVATLVGYAARDPRTRHGFPTAAASRKAYAASLLRDAGWTVATHLGTFLVIAVPVVVAIVGIKGGWGWSLSALLWAPTAGLLLFGAGHFAALGYHVSVALGSAGGPVGRSEYGYVVGRMFSDAGIPVWAGWLLVLLALVSICAAGSYWYLRRGAQNPSKALGWLYLAAAFLAVGAAVTWLSGLHGTAGLKNLGAGGMAFGLAWWTPFLLLLWDALADVVSRFLAPRLAPWLPARVVSFIQKRPSVLSGGAPAPGLPAQAARAVAPVAPGVPPRAPMTRKARRNVAIVGGAAGLVALLVVGGLVAANVIRGTHGPEVVVAQYLDALVAGNAAKALELGDPNIPNNERRLLANDVCAKATKRMDGYSITSTDITGDTAVVMTELHQDGVKMPSRFALVKGRCGDGGAHGQRRRSGDRRGRAGRQQQPHPAPRISRHVQV